MVALPLLALAVQASAGTADDLRHLLTHVLVGATRDTVLLLAGVCLFAGVVGLGTAWLVAAHRFPGRSLLGALLVLPLAVPSYLSAYAFVELLDFFGPVQGLLRALTGFERRAEYWFPEVRSLQGAVLVLGLVLYPYVYVSARLLFEQQSASLLEAAAVMGTPLRRLLTRVILPLARPALAAGLTLVALETINDIGAAEYLGVRTLSVTIYTTWTVKGVGATAAQLSLALLAIVFLLVHMERRVRGQARVSGSRQQRRFEPVQLRGWRAAAAATLCALPVLAGFVAPVGMLASQALDQLARLEGLEDALAALVNSLLVASLAGLLTVALGTAVVLQERMGESGNKGSRPRVLSAARWAGLGYAVPGTVLVLGLLPVMGLVDRVINWPFSWPVLAEWGVRAPGLILSGSLAAIVLAYVIRFLVIALEQAEVGLARVPPSIDQAARVLGARGGRLAGGVLLPLLTPAMGAALLLVFVDAVKELSATLLLRPFNFETLATLVYGAAARGSPEAAALPALMIVGVGLLPLLLVGGLVKPRKPSLRSGS